MKDIDQLIKTVEAAGYAVVTRENAWRLSPWREGQCKGICGNGTPCNNSGGRFIERRGLYCFSHRKQAWK